MLNALRCLLFVACVPLLAPRGVCLCECFAALTGHDCEGDDHETDGCPMTVNVDVAKNSPVTNIDTCIAIELRGSTVLSEIIDDTPSPPIRIAFLAASPPPYITHCSLVI